MLTKNTVTRSLVRTSIPRSIAAMPAHRLNQLSDEVLVRLTTEAVEERIIAAARRCGYPFTSSQVAKATGYTLWFVRSVMRELIGSNRWVGHLPRDRSSVMAGEEE